MWSRKVFFLLVVKIFVTVISTMDYISTLFYLRGINIYVIIYLEEEEHDRYIKGCNNNVGYRNKWQV